MRIHTLLQQLQKGIYEKNTETSLALLAALAGESMLLLGPPGVAKSMVARRLKLAFKSASSFEYLMSRFSTPDEIFGPVSISSLKASDTYVRAVKGYLPTAEVVFFRRDMEGWSCHTKHFAHDYERKIVSQWQRRNAFTAQVACGSIKRVAC